MIAVELTSPEFPVCNPIIAVSQYMSRDHGQGKLNAELLTRLSRRGWPVTAVASWLDAEAAGIDGFDWHRVLVSRKLPSHWLRSELFRRRAEKIVARSGMVTINNGAAVVARSRINIANFVHSAWLKSPWHPRVQNPGMHSRYLTAFNHHQSGLEKLAYAQADTVVATSETVRQELIEFCGLMPERVVVISPGIDAGQFRPRDPTAPNRLREFCGIDQSDTRLIAAFAGEIRSGRKNLDLVLRVAADRKELLVAVIGSTTGSPYPEMAIKLGVSDRVFFLDHRSDVAELLADADMFVFPTHYEPYGLVVTEAMACGLPILVTRGAGAAHVVEHRRHGWLLEDGHDAAGLHAGLDFLADSKIRKQCGRQARERAESMSWDHMTDEYERLL